MDCDPAVAEEGWALSTQRATILFDRAIRAAQTMPTRKKSAKLFRCPTCGMLVRTEDEDFPFCSDRCRKIDLGKWASGIYRISSPVIDPDVLDDLGLGGTGRGGGADES